MNQYEPMPTCATCRYYQPLVCRRHAPVVPFGMRFDKTMEMFASWPKVNGDFWCGDHVVCSNAKAKDA